MLKRRQIIKLSSLIMLLLVAGLLLPVSDSFARPNPQVSIQPSSEKINLNTSTVEELQKVSGIGPKIAQRIVEYRNTNGPFASVDELINVKGIGGAKFQRIKDELSI